MSSDKASKILAAARRSDAAHALVRRLDEAAYFAEELVKHGGDPSITPRIIDLLRPATRERDAARDAAMALALGAGKDD